MNNLNRDFKGIWIPAELWLSDNLTLQEKVFYVEIDSLDNEDGCYANNEYFAKFFKISKTRVSLVIKSLINKKLISSEILKEKGNKRTLRIVNKGSLIKVKEVFNESLRPSLTKVKDPLKQKLKHNNIINNTCNNINNNEEKKEQSTPPKEGFYKRIVDRYFLLYQEHTGQKPIFDGTEGHALKSIISKFPAEDIERCLELYFSEADDFTRKQGYSLRFFQTAIKGLRIPKVKKLSPMQEKVKKILGG